MKNDGYRRYRMVHYFDVWGNAEDGWEVNNQCEEFDDLHVADDATDEDIIDYLIQIDFLREDARDKVAVEDVGVGVLEITAKEDGMPLCGLYERS